MHRGHAKIRTSNIAPVDSGKYSLHLDATPSRHRVSMTMTAHCFSVTIIQKSLTVSFMGPCVAM